MKKSILARGFIGSVASLLGVLAVGCGADVGPEGAAGDSAEIGSVAQALTVNVATSPSLQFSGFIKLTNSKLLVAGGFNSNLGTGSNKIGIYDHSTNPPTFTQLRNAGNTADLFLPASLGEPEVAPIPGVTDAYLVVGGRTALDGSASNKSFVVKLNAGSALHHATIAEVGAAGSSGTAMSTGHVLGVKNLKACGTGSRLIAFGGMDSKGMRALASRTTSDVIEVFTYNAGNNGADSDWAPLKDGSNNSVFLRLARGYAQVFDVDQAAHDEFFIAGGMSDGATAVADVDKLIVDEDCVAQNVEDVDGVMVLEQATAMPAARARAASIAVSTEEDSPSANTSYEFLLGGGNNTGSTRPRDTYAFDVAGNSGLGQWFTYTNAIQAGEIFPQFVRDGSTVKLVTGLIPQTGSEAANPYFNTSANQDIYTESTTSPSWAAGTALTDSRVGAPVERLVNSSSTTVNVAIFGAKHSSTAGSGTVLSPVESTPASVIEF